MEELEYHMTDIDEGESIADSSSVLDVSQNREVNNLRIFNQIPKREISNELI